MKTEKRICSVELYIFNEEQPTKLQKHISMKQIRTKRL